MRHHILAVCIHTVKSIKRKMCIRDSASAAQMSKEAPVTRNATQAPRAATAASRAAAPATNQGAAKPAASRNTPQRQAPSRSAVEMCIRDSYSTY